jgi:hypothetical protein
MRGSGALERSEHRGECQETSGFLFSHRCGDLALDHCSQCRKPICAKYTARDLDPSRRLCTSCARQVLAENPEVFRTGWYRDDPYFYSYYHYSGQYFPHTSSSPHDPHDFTEGDEAVLGGGEATDSAVEAFEDDMGAS